MASALPKKGSIASTTSFVCSVVSQDTSLKTAQSPLLRQKKAKQPLLCKLNWKSQPRQKIVSDLSNSAQSEGCVDQACAPKEICLNVSALLDSHSLMLPITFLSHDLTPILALVDSGSSECFIGSTYVNEHSLSS